MTRMTHLQHGQVSVLLGPALAPLSIADVKVHLRIEHNAEDALLQGLIEAAAGEIDAPKGWLGRSLMRRTLRLTFYSVPPSVVRLPGPPVVLVERIVFLEPDNTRTVFYDDVLNMTDTIGADLSAEPALIWPIRGWPLIAKSNMATTVIDYVAGYGLGDDFPKPIRQWLLMRVGELYRDRECSVLGVASNRLPHADRMLDAWRVYA